ncbi:Superfamily II DNA/RNA helicase, SNF2 family [Hahella chejuensis KCTC 2396]|uniref:Superfamily II DNA/RNA helicase, SNF2 family n=1 Tax=Hahella chejuensis (strain KCTC 2396) TaxID=349521 RepID=Q2SFN8_HAHCH|nr:helicase-related protein [Hahella chejuensis]ABC30536.1 Superfamily II DNA/RNA helicase, SNF2 family [Hahella chejuensis KCTC 2396]
MSEHTFSPGSVVTARGREWIVLPQSDARLLHLRPLGGGDDAITALLPELEPIHSASFPPPQVMHSGTQAAGLLLRDALMLKLRAGAGPFRSFGNIAIEPRAYQLVPLMMALKLETIRLLIADDVGVGKTIEASLIVREMLDRAEINRFTVLCPPHLCEQWHEELKERFHLDATIVRSTTAARLERGLLQDRSIFTEHPFTIVSLDYIKNKTRRDAFLLHCPEFVIVDEAHTCARSGMGPHLRYGLLKDLAANEARHMVLLTATPHSGDEEAFYNLLSLLKPEFVDLRTIDNAAHPLRQALANHFVQRRRQDIGEWKEGNLFPDRLTSEATYKLTGEWNAIFHDVLEYARELVSRESEGTFKARMNWWAALALLRCISSSPQAAIRALNTRLDNTLSPDGKSPDEEDQRCHIEALNEKGALSVLDGTDDNLTLDDVEPGAAQEEDVAILKRLIERAKHLKSGNDPKLQTLKQIIKPVLDEGYNPVIFCRYIATAEYLADELNSAFPQREVIHVTGDLTPTERLERIEQLKESDKAPLLVATDCLSEGVNLQEQFNAVIHYDLSWNPTRHEQREGRVDRFGQKAKNVKALMYYGEENPVDGAVLQVILRKAESIRKALGVTVPMPEEGDRAEQALMKAVLLRSGNYIGSKGMDDLFAQDADLQALDAKWESAREKARRHRTLFAQNRLKPEDVLPEWEKAFAVLGTEEDVKRFVLNACERLGAPLKSLKQGGYQAPLPHFGEKHPGLRDRLDAAGLLALKHIDFYYPSALKAEFIHRTHPLVSHLADYLAELAMSGEDTKLIARAGALYTKEVETRTVIYLLRIRSRLILKRTLHECDLLAEEALAIAINADNQASVIPKDQALKLMQASVSKDMCKEAKERELAEELNQLEEKQPMFRSLAEARAKQLLADHRRTREAAQAKGSYEVKPQFPVDVLGVYVLIPDLKLF